VAQARLQTGWVRRAGGCFLTLATRAFAVATRCLLLVCLVGRVVVVVAPANNFGDVVSVGRGDVVVAVREIRGSLAGGADVWATDEDPVAVASDELDEPGPDPDNCPMPIARAATTARAAASSGMAWRPGAGPSPLIQANHRCSSSFTVRTGTNL
jgi:hypothetical protein